jgi:hypothetical protein
MFRYPVQSRATEYVLINDNFVEVMDSRGKSNHERRLHTQTLNVGLTDSSSAATQLKAIRAIGKAIASVNELQQPGASMVASFSPSLSPTPLCTPTTSYNMQLLLPQWRVIPRGFNCRRISV